MFWVYPKLYTAEQAPSCCVQLWGLLDSAAITTLTRGWSCPSVMITSLPPSSQRRASNKQRIIPAASSHPTHHCSAAKHSLTGRAVGALTPLSLTHHLGESVYWTPGSLLMSPHPGHRGSGPFSSESPVSVVIPSSLPKTVQIYERV